MKSLILTCVFLLCTSQLNATEIGVAEGNVYPDGTSSLFIGHSFFIPVAKAFDTIAQTEGYSSHQTDLVFASGVRGAPGALWNSPRHRKKIEATLTTGNINLFAMTGFGSLQSSFEDYVRWIELAQKYNPQVHILIASPWMAGGPRSSLARYEASIEKMGNTLFKVVEQLRVAYPELQITFFNYGKAASKMKRMFEQNRLNDIDRLAGGRKALFADRLMGHGGEMLTSVSALYWLHILYGTQIESLPTLGYDRANVIEIITALDKYNAQFY